ncbi:V-set domain-containing T-cell activation inhibitor 1 [Cyclopterus lumpus]|uniref:V-set domain containing T cell activation inhibitor 1 n=1 Tax=Cyclopterus lumpus TaxID=8103 RepID=A0A8C3G3V8_CYCLU|nr:V-set domain-containing T-cell activation inhibitor 1 [Cyclopterus lumpus]XP_034418353.1 V-set domain-containing T-cell activation inhibitor 1 [Cyclopterus lumpus]
MGTLGQIVFCSMITLIIIFGAAIILILALSFSGKLSEVSSNDVTPVANLGEDELLSCYLNSQVQPARFRDVSVTWEKKGLRDPVYRYLDGAPSLADQAPLFKGRTQLFPDALVAGNASLLLRSVRQSDAGEYTCSISSSGGSGKVKVQLRTAAFSVPIFKFTNGVLVAEAPRWFPEPRVTWVDFFGAVLNGSTSLVKNSAGIFQVVSRLQPINFSEIYICRIQNDLVTARSQETVTDSGVKGNTYFTFSAASSLLASTHLSIMTSVLCIYYLT